MTGFNTTLSATLAFGAPGQGLKFDGSNDWVSLASQITLVSSFTVSQWIFRTATPSVQAVTVCAGADGTDGWSVYIGSNGNHFFVKHGVVAIDSGIASALSAWEHVLWTVDTDLKPRLYINGSLAFTSTDTAAITAVTHNAALGTKLDSSNNPIARYFTGTLDEVKVYSRVLSGADITTEFGGGFGFYGAVGANLIAGYHLDGTATDFSATGNHGTLTNFNFDATDGWVGGLVGLLGGGLIKRTLHVLSAMLTNAYGVVTYGGTNGQVKKTGLSYSAPDEVSFEWRARPGGTGSNAVMLYGGHLIEVTTDHIQYWVNINNQLDTYNRSNTVFEHVVLTYSFLTNEAKLYVGGSLVRTTAIGVTKLAGPFSYLSVGAYSDSRYFIGDIDFMRVYLRIIGSTEAADRALGKPSDESALELKYEFNEGNGSSAADLGPHNWTGTLSGDATFGLVPSQSLLKLTKHIIPAAIAALIGIAQHLPNKSLTATIGLSATVKRAVVHVLPGILGLAGTVFRAVQRSLVATLPPTGAEFNQTSVPLAATLRFVGAQTRQVTRPLAASVATIGSTAKFTKRALGASVPLVAAFLGRGNKLFAGTLPSSGVISRFSTRALAATLSFSGRTLRAMTRALAATLSSVGAKPIRAIRTVGASLSFTGATSRRVARALTATLPLTAIVLRPHAKALAATLSFITARSQRINKLLPTTLMPRGLWKTAATYLTVMLYGLSDSQNELKGKTTYSTYFAVTTQVLH